MRSPDIYRQAINAQRDFDREQRRLLEERICNVQRDNPDLTCELLAERFSTSITVVTRVVKKYGLKLPGKKDFWGYIYVRGKTKGSWDWRDK